VQVESVVGEEGLRALREPWETLVRAGAATTPFQSWATTYHAVRIDDGVVEPLVLVAREAGGSLAGLLPLGLLKNRRGPLEWRTLQTIGPKRLDFVDVIATSAQSDAVITACVDWLASHWSDWDELHLTPLREDARLLVALRRIEPSQSLVIRIDEVDENFALEIPALARSWEDLLDGETRRTTRRIVKRLDASGFEVRRVSAGWPLEAAVDAFVDLHARRRREFGQVSRYLDVDRDELHALVADAVAEGGDLALLERDGAPAAAQLTLRLGEQVSHYRLAFDSEQRSFSPGIGLLAAGVNDAIRAGVREYDFGFGAEEYKRRWASLRRKVYRVRIANRHLGRVPRRAWSFAFRTFGGLRNVARKRRAHH
jgi:CelD/BcsL family acetyltransferase involved in cellulose biosynthesis